MNNLAGVAGAILDLWPLEQIEGVRLSGEHPAIVPDGKRQGKDALIDVVEVDLYSRSLLGLVLVFLGLGILVFLFIAVFSGGFLGRLCGA